jgi:tetratricopeptide (TPR) repeat protein
MRVWAGMAVAAGLAACAPDDPAAALVQNLRVCEAGAFADARLTACSAVIASSAADPEQRAAALVHRGVLRAELGQHARAVADFGRALRLDAENAEAYSERGLVHQQRGAFDRALRDYEEALRLDPYHSLAAYRRQQAVEGRVTAFLSQIDQLTEIIASEPENGAALNNRCWLRAINDQDLTAALADCDRALALDPRHGAALDSRGLVHLKRGDFSAALADYEAALALEPERGHYLYGRGLARLRLGQFELGQSDLAAAELSEPGVAQAYAAYGAMPDVAPATAPGMAVAAKP